MGLRVVILLNMLGARAWLLSPPMCRWRVARGAASEDELREQAERLREQAAQMEDQLVEQQGAAAISSSSTTVHPFGNKPAEWFRLEGSRWQLTLNLKGFKEERASASPVSVNAKVALMPPGPDGLAPVQVLEPSRFITKGFVWSVGKGLDDNSDDTCLYLRFNVRGEGLSIVPDGSLYVNARITRGSGASEGDQPLQLTDGLVTFKRPQKTRFLFMVYDGLLAEFKVVGECSLRPIAAP